MNDKTMQRLREIVVKEIQSLKYGLESNAVNAAKIAWCEETEENILQALAAEIERAEVGGMEKAKNIIADKMKRDIKALEPYLKDLQSKTGATND